MDSFLDTLTREIFRMKTNVEKDGFAATQTVNELLGLFLASEKQIEQLRKQLNYALETGGEYLTVEQYIN